MSTLEYVALYALMGDKAKLLKYLKLLIKESPSDKYNVINWPLFEEYRDDEQIKSVLKPELHKCQIKF